MGVYMQPLWMRQEDFEGVKRRWLFIQLGESVACEETG